MVKPLISMSFGVFDVSKTSEACFSQRSFAKIVVFQCL